MVLPANLATGDKIDEAWVDAVYASFRNMPWGRVAGGMIAVPDQVGIANVETNLTGYAVTFTAIANRLYTLRMILNGLQQTTAAFQVIHYKLDGAGSTRLSVADNLPVGQSAMHTGARDFAGLAAGSHTFQLTAWCGAGTMQVRSTSQVAGFMVVDDVGPVTVTP